MNKILHLLKLDYLIDKKSTNKAKNIWANLSTLIVWGLILPVCAVIFLHFAIKASEIEYSLKDFVSIILFVISVIIFIYTMSIQQKNVYLYKNKTHYSYLPVKKYHIYFAKMLRAFIDTFALSFVIVVAAMITAGVLNSATISFYFESLFVATILTILPFAFAAIILIPVSYLLDLLKNFNLVKLIINIILTLMLFYIYSEIVFALSGLLLMQNAQTSTVIQTMQLILTIDFLPTEILARCMINNYSLNTIILIIVSLVSVTISLVVGSVCYKYVFNKSQESSIMTKTIKTHNVVRSNFKTYFVMELRDLFRSSLYSYTYIGMACAMPIMVLICNNFILSFAENNVGSTISFGTTLLVVMMFLSIICSTSATFISKEGDNFWMLKTNPKGALQPLIAKSIVGLVIAVPSLIITFIIIVSCGYISIVEALIVFATALVFIFGLVCKGLTINLIKPNLFVSDKQNNFNIFLQSIISAVISIAIGVFAIIYAFKLAFWLIALIVFGSILFFAMISAFLLGANYKKLFALIEV